jgi:coenzyme F420 biosynthesis associated uncharacterized protein
MTATATVAPLVDWDVAVSTARRLIKPGPEVSPDEAREVVADLRARAAEATDHVRDFTRLDASHGSAPVIVIDRLGWVQANVDAFESVLAPLAERIAARKANTGSGGQSAIGAKLAGVEAGGLLSYLSGRVLGQFDPFHETSYADSSTPDTRGRLMLVAPNVVTVERELEADPGDFRLWVCLHEETHRVQFTAVPWLRDFLRTNLADFVAETELDPAALATRLREGVAAVFGALRSEGSASLIDIVQTERQRAILDRLTGVMSLLEGHAEYVMDGVGPDVVPTVAEIRARFQRRRAGRGTVDQVIRRVLGLEMKMAQYRDGERFVRAVVDRAGLDTFNQVWTSEEMLPSKAEIADPDSWLARAERG